jgi:hypothetical protein
MDVTKLEKYLSKKSAVAVTTVISLSTMAAKSDNDSLLMAAMMTVVAVIYMALDFVKQIKLGKERKEK